MESEEISFNMPQKTKWGMLVLVGYVDLYERISLFDAGSDCVEKKGANY